MPGRKTLKSLLLIVAVSCAISCSDNSSRAHRIVDEANILTEQQEQNLYALALRLEKNYGIQPAVMTVESIGTEPIVQYAGNKRREAGLGRKEFDDGILILVVNRDQKVRIDVGKGLKEILNENLCNRIIQEKVIPMFNSKNYYQGINDAMMTISYEMEFSKDRLKKVN